LLDIADHFDSLDIGDGGLMLYQRNIPSDFFTLILDGKANVEAGREKFLSEVSRWTCLCEDVLRRRPQEGEFVPDFSATVTKNARILRISSKRFWAAVAGEDAGDTVADAGSSGDHDSKRRVSFSGDRDGRARTSSQHRRASRSRSPGSRVRNRVSIEEIHSEQVLQAGIGRSFQHLGVSDRSVEMVSPGSALRRNSADQIAILPSVFSPDVDIAEGDAPPQGDDPPDV
jgi:hypothetical protein